MKKYFLKKSKLSFIAVLATMIISMIVKVQAQTPTVQDCPGAIPVCEGYYYQPNSFTGTGNYPNEIAVGYNCSTNECMNAGEKNDVWYIINAIISQFIIDGDRKYFQLIMLPKDGMERSMVNLLLLVYMSGL